MTRNTINLRGMQNISTTSFIKMKSYLAIYVFHKAKISFWMKSKVRKNHKWNQYHFSYLITTNNDVKLDFSNSISIDF